MNSKPLTYIEVDLSALKQNLRHLQKKYLSTSQVLFVIKSQGYGHGMIEVAKAVSHLNFISYFGVSSAEEAILLRRQGIRRPVLVLGIVHPNSIPELIHQKVTFTISSEREAKSLNRICRTLGKKAKVHVELDTGMGRLGVAYPKALSLLFRVKELSHVILEGIYSHFPSADKDLKFSKRQIQIFQMVIELFQSQYPKGIRYMHMANSIGILKFPQAHFNMVRPGIMVYGMNPVPEMVELKLKPVLSLKTKIILIKNLKKGQTISYGRTHRLSRDTRIATLPIGYSSGYPISLSRKAHVLIKGRSYPIVGRITMDHLMVDIGKNSSIKEWDAVTLIGKSGKKRIDVESLAKASKTIPYEIVTSLSPQIPRIYKN